MKKHRIGVLCFIAIFVIVGIFYWISHSKPLLSGKFEEVESICLIRRDGKTVDLGRGSLAKTIFKSLSSMRCWIEYPDLASEEDMWIYYKSYFEIKISYGNGAIDTIYPSESHELLYRFVGDSKTKCIIGERKDHTLTNNIKELFELCDSGHIE